MIKVKYIPNMPHVTPETQDQYEEFVGIDTVTIEVYLEEAMRIRAALSDLSAEDLDNYGEILERLRKALPQ